MDKQQLETLLKTSVNSGLTAQKVAEKIEDGYQISGLVIVNPKTGERCIIDSSAGRWLSSKEMQWLMHESESPLNNDVAR